LGDNHSLKSAFEGVAFADGTRVGVISIAMRTSDDEHFDEPPIGVMRYLERQYFGEVSIAWDIDLALGDHPGKELGMSIPDDTTANPTAVGSLWAVACTAWPGLPVTASLQQRRCWNSGIFFRLLDEPDAVVAEVEREWYGNRLS
jgi:hypothetical protein